jgi:CRP-like cAMP-binding protein
MAQDETRALRVKVEVLREEFKQGGEFQQIIMNYLHQILSQISQSALCHRFHTVEQRFATWLLISSDRVNSEEFSLQQDCIGRMLGVPRTNVSMTANPLQQRSLISYSRGRIEIINRQRLKQVACECYRMIKRETATLYQ